MPSFYFNLFNLISATDPEGRDCSSVDEARKEAKADIHSILRDDIASYGRVDLRGRIEITDGNRNVVETVDFLDAIELLLPEPRHD